MATYEPRQCALESCRATFTPTRAYQKFCRHDHARDAGNRITKAERIARRAAKAERHPKAKYIHEASRDTPPGICPWCDERFPTPRHRTNCGKRECVAAYQRAYRVGRSEVDRGGPLTPRVCSCGCGSEFLPRDKRQTHVDEAHWRAHTNRRKREERAANPRPIGRPKRGRAIRFGKRTESKEIRPFWP